MLPVIANYFEVTVDELLGKMGCYYEACDPEGRIASRQRRIDLMDAMFKVTGQILLSSIYCNCLIELAMLLADAGRAEEAVAALIEAIDRYEEHYQLGKSLSSDAQGKVHLSDPMWNCLSQSAFPRKLKLSFLKKLTDEPEYTQNEAFQTLLERVRTLN